MGKISMGMGKYLWGWGGKLEMKKILWGWGGDGVIFYHVIL